MGDELDWAAPGGRTAFRLVHEGNCLLPLPTRGEARHFGVGAGEPGARVRRGSRAREAPLRLLLHQIFLALARRADRLPNDQDDADWLGSALRALAPNRIQTESAVPREHDPAAALALDFE